MPTIPFEISKPAEPEKVPCLLISGTLNSGQPFDFAIRADENDSFDDSGEYVTCTNGQTGQTVQIAKSQVAMVSRVTAVQVLKDIPTVPMVKPKEKSVRVFGISLDAGGRIEAPT
jgi:hypothetical protein